MTLDILLALIGFAFVASITPGPNNLMLMASGANYGFRRSVPHILGVVLGFPSMIFLVGIGVMTVFDAWPVSYVILKAISVVYLLFLAWKIATATATGNSKPGGRPLTFFQSAGFQWVNPKGWTMALSSITLYAAARDIASVFLVALVFVAVSACSTACWTTMGLKLQSFLRNPARLRRFNLTMALLLLLTLAPVLWPV